LSFKRLHEETLQSAELETACLMHCGISSARALKARIHKGDVLGLHFWMFLYRVRTL